MKKTLLIWAVLATAAVVACVPEEKVDDAPKKSSECKLSSLVVNVETETRAVLHRILIPSQFRPQWPS